MNFRDMSEVCEQFLSGLITQHEFLIKLFDMLSHESEESIVNFATVMRFMADLQSGNPLDGRH